MRRFRSSVLGAGLLALALVATACGDSGGDGEDAAAGGETIASQLTLGGPPECPEREFCIPGLRDVYGIEFGEFVPLDVGGPLTVEALAGGEIDVGLLFSTDGAIIDRGFVLLEDDEGLQQADNIAPVIRTEVLNDEIEGILNDISGALTTENMTELNGRVTIDGEDPADVAGDFLDEEGLLPDGGEGGESVTVGAVSFAENQILGEMYAQALEAANYDVDRQLDLDSREILQPAIENGEVDVAPEYLATLIVFLGGEASPDPDELVEPLDELLAEKGQTLLEFSDAVDTNAFVVTQETADEFDLSAVSDLAEPAE